MSSTQPSLPFAPQLAVQPIAVEPIAVQPVAVQPIAVQPFTVEVLRSKRRKRSVAAQLIGDTLHITVPTWMSRAEEAEWIEKMAASYRRQLSTERINLRQRALLLARRHDLPRPREIRWDDTMVARWGSCTIDTGEIRLSTRLAAFPNWVLDYVIVHELCHMAIEGHTPQFWELVNRYPKAERAIGYLIAKSGEKDDDTNNDSTAGA